MRREILDRYTRLDSLVHRRPAAPKLAAALLVAPALALSPLSAWPVFAAAALVLLALAVLSRVPFLRLAGRVLLFAPFVLGVALLALWQPNGGWVFAGLVTKSTLCVFTMILLSETTPFSDVLLVLRRWRVPALLVTTLALMHRYVFVLWDEAERMRRARLSRTFGRRRRTEWKLRASVLGQLFVRSAERAERIHAAMCARGWR